jgi:ribosomal protein S18 acetylase RimI-like enzyme
LNSSLPSISEITESSWKLYNYHVITTFSGSVHIRPAVPADLPGMARVRVETWRSAYTGIVPADHLERLSVERTVERWRQRLFINPRPGSAVFVAEVNGEVVGIAICAADDEGEAADEGRVYVLYVLPDYQRRGIGRGLMRVCADHLLAQGMRSLSVWVLKQNLYRRFYESLGGVLAGEKQVEIGDMMLPEVAYRWSDVRLLMEQDEITTE